YAYRRTLFRSGVGPTLQHPTMAIELAGAGEVVLTVPARASATIEGPSGRERYLVFAIPSAAVLGEMAADEVPRLALPAGPIPVARPSSRATAVGPARPSVGGPAPV